MITTTIFLLSMLCLHPIFCSKSEETTLKSDSISLSVTTALSATADLISIDSLTQEIESQNKYLSPSACAAKIVGTDQYWKYLKLNGQYLKCHEDKSTDNPSKPMIRSKPDENFQFQEMPRDIAALFVSLKMQQKIDAKRKW